MAGVKRERNGAVGILTLLPLEGALPQIGGEQRYKRGFIGLSLFQPCGMLAFRHFGSLHPQAQIGDPLPLRRGRVFGTQALILQRPQAGIGFLEGIPAGRQRRFTHRPLGNRLLQGGRHRYLVDLQQGFTALHQLIGDTRQLLGSQGPVPVEIFELAATLPLGVPGLLQLPRQGLLQGTGFPNGAIPLPTHRLCRIQAAALQFGHLAATLKLSFGTHQAIPLGLLCVGNLPQVTIDLAAALLVARPGLVEFEHFDLLGMHPGLESLGITTQAGNGILQTAGQGFRLAHHAVGHGRIVLGRLHFHAQVLDFPLAFDDPVRTGIRCIVTEGMTIEEPPLPRHQHRADRQFAAPLQPAGEIVSDKNPAQPGIQGFAKLRIRLDEGAQRAGTRRRIAPLSRRNGPRQQKGHCPRHLVGQRCQRGLSIRRRQRSQPFPKHGFNRQLPSRLDAYALPQGRQGVQVMPFEPIAQLPLHLHLTLQLHQRLPARPQFGGPALGLALGLDGLLEGLLSCGHLGSELSKLGLGTGQTVLSLFKHRLPLGQLTRVRRLNRRLFLLQPRTALGQRLKGALAAHPVGLLNTDLLLGVIQFATHRGGGGIGSAQGFFRLGQPFPHLGMAGIGLLDP